MTTYAKREIVSRRIEYGVESGQPIGEFDTVYGIAHADWARRNGIDPKQHGDAGWARLEARDDEIVIAFTVEADADAADQADRIKAVLDLADRLDALGWEQALTHGDDIPQAIRRALGRTP